MRILMMSHGYPPTVSGVTLFTQRFSRNMMRRGHEVTVVTASDCKQPYSGNDDGVKIVRVRSTRNPFWKEGPLPWVRLRTLIKLIRRFQPDLLHTHESAFLALQTLRLARQERIPILATCYYLPRFVARYLSGKGVPKRLIEGIAWSYTIKLFNRFDKVVFLSRSQREEFIHRGLKVPTAVISCGVDLARYHPAGGRLKNRDFSSNLPPEPRILFVSRLAREKEIDILIKAMVRVLSERKAHLLLVGRGSERTRLEKMVKSLGLLPFVHFLGFIPENDLPALYRKAGVFAIASKCEVLSLPTLQALATGLPVVVVDAAALPELVNEGVNGFIVPPDDPDLASRMGQASFNLVKLHGEERTFELYEDLYQQMLSG